jgi:hypothetical protein
MFEHISPEDVAPDILPPRPVGGDVVGDLGNQPGVETVALFRLSTPSAPFIAFQARAAGTVQTLAYTPLSEAWVNVQPPSEDGGAELPTENVCETVAAWLSYQGFDDVYPDATPLPYERVELPTVETSQMTGLLPALPEGTLTDTKVSYPAVMPCVLRAVPRAVTADGTVPAITLWARTPETAQSPRTAATVVYLNDRWELVHWETYSDDQLSRGLEESRDHLKRVEAAYETVEIVGTTLQSAAFTQAELREALRDEPATPV